MLPSAQQKRIAKLRTHAIEHSLHVKLSVSLSFPKDCLKSSHPYYCKQRKAKPEPLFIHLLRDVNSKIFVMSDGEGTKDFLLSLEDILHALPQEYDAIYIRNGLIGLSWNEEETEQDEIPERLFSSLTQLEDLIFN